MQQDMASWVKFFDTAPIPVLRQTARALENLQQDQDHINARQIAQVITADPMMTMRLLRHLQKHRHQAQLHDLVQVEQAIMMMGLDTFFKKIPANLCVENHLQTHPQALLHLLRTVRRAQRSAHYAFSWALLLHDLHAEETRIAALLLDLAEILMWLFNPEAMLRIRALQEADASLRSVAAQTTVLGFSSTDLQLKLQQEWQLPQLLQQLSNPALAESSRVRNVILAANLARHSAHGWENAALPDDYRDIANLLRLDVPKVMHMVGAPLSPETLEK